MSLPVVKKEEDLKEEDVKKEEDDDYMNMAFDDVNPVQETSLQRTRRLKQESRARGFVKSRSSIAAEAAEARDRALAMSLLDNPRTKNSKGLAMMNKMGFTGGALGSGPDSTGPTEPLMFTIKDDRGGIGHESKKKRRQQEAAAKHETKAARTDPSEFRNRNRRLYAEGRMRGKMHGLQRLALELDNKVSNDPKAPRPPLKELPVFYRGKVRRREWKARKLEAEGQGLLSSRLRVKYEDGELDGDDGMALGLDHKSWTTVTDVDETDEELDDFEALSAREQFLKVLAYIRDQHKYCFFCKTKYPDETMEGCPGMLEEDHF